MDQEDKLEIEGLWERLVHQVKLDSQEIEEALDQQEQLANQDNPDFKVTPDSQGNRGTVDLQGQAVRLDQLDSKGHQASKVHQDNKDRKDLLGPQGLPVNEDQWDNLGH